MNFYYASRFGNIKYVKELSELSFWPHIVHNLNRYHLKNNKPWRNEDLEKDYLLTPNIYFKKGKEPQGIPYLYTGLIEYNQIIVKKDFPYIFKNKCRIKIRKLDAFEHFNLIDLSKSIQGNFNGLDI